MVMVCLRGATPAAHLPYLGKRNNLPIRPLEIPDRVDRMFDKLQRAIPSPPWKYCHRQVWILPETWSLINTRIAARQQKDQRRSWDLSRTIKVGLQDDRRRRAAKAGSAVDSLLVSNLPLIKEAWIRMRGWYKAAVNRPPPPARVDLATMTKEREELYWQVLLSGDPIPVGELPLLVDYGIP